mmetsp:Transcript_6702/g.24159  ORF Transcript_6702/g.24159 Transcript_6702/m.24159 type:complete len:288 (-) Transcript_6702:13-876(-)
MALSASPFSPERNEPGGGGGSNSWPSVGGWLIRDGELSEVVSDHLRLDLDLVEALSVVDSDDGSDHLWHDDHVPKVGPHGLWLLSGWGLLLGLVQLLDEGVRLALQATRELPPWPRAEQVDELVLIHVKKLLQVNAPERKLLESSPLWCVTHGCCCCAVVAAAVLVLRQTKEEKEEKEGSVTRAVGKAKEFATTTNDDDDDDDEAGSGGGARVRETRVEVPRRHSPSHPKQSPSDSLSLEREKKKKRTGFVLRTRSSGAPLSLASAMTTPMVVVVPVAVALNSVLVA